jgi:hypothetical protein
MAKIKKLNADEITKPLGYKVGSLEGVTYGELVELLGEPTWDTASGDDKVQKEWVVKFGDKQFTIYDWKTYDQDYTINSLTQWIIGGTEPSYQFEDALYKELSKLVFTTLQDNQLRKYVK